FPARGSELDSELEAPESRGSRELTACHTEGVPAPGKYLRWSFSVPLALLCLRALPAFQRPFREYPPMEAFDSTAPIPPDYRDPAEFVLGRLMYPSTGGRGRGGGGDWTQGGAWTVDYPRAERHFALALRRLTRVDVRSVEQPVNPDDDDDIF